MRTPIMLTCLFGLLLPAPASAVMALREIVPPNVQGDSLEASLHDLEARDRGPRGASAVWHLAMWHQLRGEYGQARAAYLRAAQRLSGDERHWARIGAARAALALGAPAEARGAASEALRASGPIRAAARMATAQALELEGHKAQALELYSKLLSEQPGEIGASALERAALLHDQLKHPDAAAETRRRLVREYPASPEAARNPAVAPRPVVKP